MTGEWVLPAQRTGQQEPEPDAKDQLVVNSQPDDYLQDEWDPDSQPGAECSSYIPRYATS